MDFDGTDVDLGRDHAREQRLQTLRRSRGSFKPDDRAAAIMEAILG
jgi:hypothetical protein